jgi:hypothetical protein
MARTGFGAVFQNRNFLILWAGQLFSQLADKVYLVSDDRDHRGPV